MVKLFFLTSFLFYIYLNRKLLTNTLKNYERR